MKPLLPGAFPTCAAPSIQSLTAWIHAFSQGTVLIVGDIMLDTYYSGDADRISPEAPVPVVHVTEERHVLGGAGNVARNIAALGGKAVLLGVRGDDAAGEQLACLVAASAMRADISVHPARPTTVKSRILARGQQMIRFDREQTDVYTFEEEEALLNRVAQHLAGCGAVVVSDYGKGLVTASFMRGLQARLNALPISMPILVDPKPGNIDAYAGVTLLTPNTKETSESVHMPVSSPETVVQAGRALMRRLGSKHLITTLGAEGMAVFEDQQTTRHIPTMARKVFDVTGAGDTVIATTALALAVGAPLLEASVLANHAAGVVVGEIGAATCTADQLVEAVTEAPTLRVEDWS